MVVVHMVVGMFDLKCSGLNNGAFRFFLPCLETVLEKFFDFCDSACVHPDQFTFKLTNLH